jgi:hypothetical protein
VALIRAEDRTCNKVWPDAAGRRILVEPRAAQSAERSDPQPLAGVSARPPARLPLGVAALLIATLSGVLWLGLIRLLDALL